MTEEKRIDWKARAAEANLAWKELWDKAYRGYGIKEFTKYDTLDKETQKKLWKSVQDQIIAEEERRAKIEKEQQEKNAQQEFPAEPPPEEPEPVNEEVESAVLDSEAEEAIEEVKQGIKGDLDFQNRELALRQEAQSSLERISPKRLEDIRTMAKMILDMTKEVIKESPPESFVVFGDSVCFNAKAIDRIVSQVPLPISVIGKPISTNIIKEGKYKGYEEFTAEGTVYNRLTHTSFDLSHTECTAKDFWCVRKDPNTGKSYRRAPEDIDFKTRADVIQATRDGLFRRAVKRILGLKSTSIEEAEKFGLPIRQWLRDKKVVKAR